MRATSPICEEVRILVSTWGHNRGSTRPQAWRGDWKLLEILALGPRSAGSQHRAWSRCCTEVMKIWCVVTGSPNTSRRVRSDRLNDATRCHVGRQYPSVAAEITQKCSGTDQSWALGPLGNVALSPGINGPASVQLIPAITGSIACIRVPDAPYESQTSRK